MAGIVPNEYESCVVVSSARLPCLVAVYREHSQARLITTEDIFRRYLTLAKLFSAIPQKLQLNEPVAMLLIPNEYFFYSGSFFIAYPNFWHEPSYELHLTGRITAVLNGCRISDQKEIYNACKQSHISK